MRSYARRSRRSCGRRVQKNWLSGSKRGWNSFRTNQCDVDGGREKIPAPNIIGRREPPEGQHAMANVPSPTAGGNPLLVLAREQAFRNQHTAATLVRKLWQGAPPGGGGAPSGPIGRKAGERGGGGPTR